MTMQIMSACLMAIAIVAFSGCVGERPKQDQSGWVRSGVSCAMSADEINGARRSAFLDGDGNAAYAIYEHYAYFSQEVELADGWLYVAMTLGNLDAKSIFDNMAKHKDRNGDMVWTRELREDERWEPMLSDILTSKGANSSFSISPVAKRDFEKIKCVIGRFHVADWRPLTRLEIQCAAKVGVNISDGDRLLCTTVRSRIDGLNLLVVYDAAKGHVVFSLAPSASSPSPD